MNAPRKLSQLTRDLLARLPPRQRQYAMLAGILAGGVGLLWLVFAFTDSSTGRGGS